VAQGWGGHRWLIGADGTVWRYAEWQQQARQIAQLRVRALCQIIDKAQVSQAWCAARLADELAATRTSSAWWRQARYFGHASRGAAVEMILAPLAERQPASFMPVATAANDVCLLAFTVGLGGLLLFR
jgi:2-aminobenzoate-CoA ligase